MGLSIGVDDGARHCGIPDGAGNGRVPDAAYFAGRHRANGVADVAPELEGGGTEDGEWQSGEAFTVCKQIVDVAGGHRLNGVGDVAQKL
jgi:hypothetical protein